MSAKLIVYVSLQVEVDIEDEIVNSEVYDEETTVIRDKLYKAFKKYDIGMVQVEPGVLIVRNGSDEPEIYDL
jgi:hypothetical protein